MPRRDDAPIATRRPPGADDLAPVARPAPRDARVAAPSAPDVTSPAPSRPAVPEAAAGAGGGDLKALTAKISLQVLTWAPEPKDRFVFLNGRRYGEGQLVDDKLLVERITEDGVVLSYRGERVTLKGR
jgi:general secretion pathway protein B